MPIMLTNTLSHRQLLAWQASRIWRGIIFTALSSVHKTFQKMQKKFFSFFVHRWRVHHNGDFVCFGQMRHMECRVSLWNLQTHIPFSPNWHAKNPSSWEAFCEPRRNPGHLDIIAISCHHHHNALSAPHYNIPPPYLSHKDCCHCLSSSGWDEREERKTSDKQDAFLKVWLLV